MDRCIFHIDMNNFYASVECMERPFLRGRVFVVGGREEDRHGIVLAKSQEAKSLGIRTGMTLYEARSLYPSLIVVPPSFHRYVYFSRMARAIYREYTDLVEPYGLDECYLDLTGSLRLFGEPLKIAEILRERIFEELGLTVSIGISYNKVFAKLGSDYKKPCGLTVFSRESLDTIIRLLPAGDLLFVGPKSASRLRSSGIRTIGELADADPRLLKVLFGKRGEVMQIYARGEDMSPVCPAEDAGEILSVGHGVTCKEDISTEYEVFLVILNLAGEVARKLAILGKKAALIQLSLRDSLLQTRSLQLPLSPPARTETEIAFAAKRLLSLHPELFLTPLRSVTVRVSSLRDAESTEQLSLFEPYALREKREKLSRTVLRLRERFGEKAVFPASLLLEQKIPGHEQPSVLPMSGLREQIQRGNLR